MAAPPLWVLNGRIGVRPSRPRFGRPPRGAVVTDGVQANGKCVGWGPTRQIETAGRLRMGPRTQANSCCRPVYGAPYTGERVLASCVWGPIYSRVISAVVCGAPFTVGSVAPVIVWGPINSR